MNRYWYGWLGGISFTIVSRALILNLDSHGEQVWTRHYLRFEIGLWALGLLVRLGPIRADVDVRVKHNHLAVDTDLRLIWSHR